MEKVYFAADLHLGHKQIHKYRPFETPEAHDDHIEERYLSVVRKKKQTVYLLGDICFDADSWRRLDNWPGTKVIILGNHDTERVSFRFLSSLRTVRAVHSMLDHSIGTLSHAPIHPDHLRGKINIHGHLHGLLIDDPRYFNVSLENTDYAPISIEEIKRQLALRKIP